MKAISSARVAICGGPSSERGSVEPVAGPAAPGAVQWLSLPRDTPALGGFITTHAPTAVLLGGDLDPGTRILERGLLREARQRDLLVLGMGQGARALNSYFGGAHAEEGDCEVGPADLRLSPWVSPDALAKTIRRAYPLRKPMLSKELVAFAWTAQGCVAAFHHRHEPIVGMLWEATPRELESPPPLLWEVLAGRRPWPTEGPRPKSPSGVSVSGSLGGLGPP